MNSEYVLGCILKMLVENNVPHMFVLDLSSILFELSSDISCD